MLKVGDKLMCKMEFNSGCGSYIIFYKENMYEILGSDFFSKTLYKVGAIDSNVDSNYIYFSDDEINNYFYDDIEMRKKKLERLANVELSFGSEPEI